MKTSYYISRFLEDSHVITHSSTSIDDELFDETENSAITKEISEYIEWISELSESNPSFRVGLDESLLSWFLQSFYLFPKMLNLPFCEESDSTSSALKVFLKNNVFSEETIDLIREFVETAPTNRLICLILEDIHNYSKYHSEIDLKETGEFNVMLSVDKINQIMRILDLPPFVPNRSKYPHVANDPHRNGAYLNSLYCRLTGKSVRLPKIALNKEQALQNISFVIDLFTGSKYLDSSFANAPGPIVKGSVFVLQQVISSVLSSYACRVLPPAPKKQQEISIQVDESSEKKVSSKIQDGMTLVKLLMTLDEEVSTIPHLFCDPASLSERRWNIKKSVEFLQSRQFWPKSLTIDPKALFDGSYAQAVALVKGLCRSYNDKLPSIEHQEGVFAYLGIDFR